MNNGVASKDIDISRQVALVTGGSRGLGRAFAQALAAGGMTVVVTARSKEGLAETVRLVEEANGRAVALPADVSDPAEVERVMVAVQEQLGRVDVLVNNGGVMAPIGPDWEIDPEAWWRTFEVNVRGAFLCAQAVLPGMIARRRGRIINISSGAANGAHAYVSAYGPSKAALTQWTGCLAQAVKEYGIAVFAYAPGFTRTAMTEFLAESPDVHRWLGTGFRDVFDEGQDTPMARAIEMFLFLISGRADALSGRHIDVDDAEGELLQRAEEIQRNDLYTLRRRT